MDNVLEDIVIELDSYKKIVGNVYRARVIDVLPGMQAAFVDIGYDKNAFLHVSDIYPLLDEKQLKIKKKKASSGYSMFYNQVRNLWSRL